MKSKPIKVIKTVNELVTDQATKLGPANSDGTDPESPGDRSIKESATMSIDPVLDRLLTELNQFKEVQEQEWQVTLKCRSAVSSKEQEILELLLIAKTERIVHHESMKNELALLDELKDLAKQSETYSPWYHKINSKKAEIIGTLNEQLRGVPYDNGDEEPTPFTVCST